MQEFFGNQGGTFILVFIIIFLIIAGISAYMIPKIGSEVNKRSRIKQVTPTTPNSVSFVAEKLKKQNVKQNISEVVKRSNERNQKANAFTLDLAMERAGWKRGRQVFLSACAIGAFLGAITVFALSGSALGLLVGAFFGGVGLPMMYLRITGARRKERFLRDLPIALDVISRTVRGGLPITDAIRIAGRDAAGPIHDELLRTHDAVVLGRSLEEAFQEMYQRIPCQEINFMALVISIQQRTGGNLTEVIDNLGNLLRERVILEKRVVALTQDVRVSSYIISALPFFLTLGFYLIEPDYISLLWTTELGLVVLAGTFVWAFLSFMLMKSFSNVKV